MAKDDSGELIVYVLLFLFLVFVVLKVLEAIWQFILFLEWWNLAVVAFIVIIVIKIVKAQKKEKKRIEEEERQKSLLEAERERERLAQERQKQLLAEFDRQNRLKQYGFFKLNHRGQEAWGDKAINLMMEKVQYPIIIDTNIWMNFELDCFFAQLLHCCKISKSSITIPGAVYEEIQKLRKDNERKKSASVAFKRIQHFSDEGVLNVHNLKKTHEKDAYADKDLIDLCQEWSLKKEPFYLLTNDKDLTFRINNLLKEKEFCHIVSVEPTEFATSEYAKNFIPYIN